MASLKYIEEMEKPQCEKKIPQVTLKMEAANLSKIFVSTLSTNLHGITFGSL
jgi:hypothetical protein